uniref:Uncharacterized protein n=1 Tax=Amphimedon queenslandica TaxID=400682 RepID=A0A1X7UVW6_AMPQE
MENSEIEDKHFWLAAEDIQKTLEYTKEVQDQLKSYDFSKRERIFQGISSIYEKLRNSESYWRQTEIEIENEKTKVESEINEMCQSVVPSSKTPTIENAQETVEELTESLREEKQLLKTLMQKTKDRECIKYEFKLQKKSLPVHFNESSTVDTVQGCILLTYQYMYINMYQ